MELYNSTLYNSANLLAYWRFEGNSNDAKNSNNGTDSNITYSLANGKFNQGAGFNGTSSKITVPTFFSGTGNFTILGWVKPTSNGNRKIFLNMGTATTNNVNFFLSSEATTNVLHFEIYGGTSGSASGNLGDGSYHMIGAVRTSNAVQLYVDGAASGSTIDVTALNVGAGSNTFIGALDNDTFWYPGALDDFAFFNTNISAANISALYVGSIPRFGILGVL